MKYRLRSLMIVGMTGPPLLAGLYMLWRGDFDSRVGLVAMLSMPFVAYWLLSAWVRNRPRNAP
jgi:hypothetical protein